MQGSVVSEAIELSEHQAKVATAVWAHIYGFCPPRFSSYVKRHGPLPVDILAHYMWNLKVSEALLPTLSVAEVLLRNSINNVMVKKHGPYWFDKADFQKFGEANHLAKAKADAKRLEDQRGRVISPDDIVCELGFGYWANILRSEYSKTVWAHLLYGAFPNMPAGISEKRREARRVFSDACSIRNRVCHGERVIHLDRLDRRQAAIVRAVEWMSQPSARILRKTDRFSDVWNNGLAECHKHVIDMIPVAEAAPIQD